MIVLNISGGFLSERVCEVTVVFDKYNMEDTAADKSYRSE